MSLVQRLDDVAFPYRATPAPSPAVPRGAPPPSSSLTALEKIRTVVVEEHGAIARLVAGRIAALVRERQAGGQRGQRRPATIAVAGRRQNRRTGTSTSTSTNTLGSSTSSSGNQHSPPRSSSPVTARWPSPGSPTPPGAARPLFSPMCPS